MTVKVEGYPKFKAFIPGTNTLAVGYQLFTYVPGTSTKKTTYQDYAKGTANTNPIILDSNGECFLVLDGLTKLVLAPDNDTDPPASPSWTYDNVGEADTSASSVGVVNKIPNGSFETDTDGDGTPDDWVFVAGTSNTMTIVETTNWHADSCLEVVIASANTAVATTSLFEVAEGSEEVFRWAMKASAANAAVTARVKWYDENEIFISNSDIYTDSATNPTSWTDKFGQVTVPSTARYAKFELRTATSGVTVQYDNVRNYALEFKDVALTVTGAWSFDNGVTSFGSTTPGDNWPSTYNALEIGATGSVSSSGTSLDLAENAYFDDTDSRWEYQNTGEASRVSINGGEVSLFVAASGTADTAITFKEFVVESDGTVKNLAGNMLVSAGGTDITPAHELVVYLNGANDTPGVSLQNVDTGVTSSDGFLITLNASEAAQLINYENTDIDFYTNNAFVGSMSPGGFWVIADTEIAANVELTIYDSGVANDTYVQFLNDGTGTTSGDGFLVGVDSSENGALLNKENTDITFSTNNAFAGKVDANGNWLISVTDTTPAHELIIYEDGISGTPVVGFQNGTTGVASGDGSLVGLDASENMVLNNQEATHLIFYTSGNFAGKIHSGGNWVVGNSDITPNLDFVIYKASLGDDAYLQFLNDGTGTTSTDGAAIGINTGEELEIRQYEAGAIEFYTGNAFAGKVDDSKRWLFADSDMTAVYDVTIYDATAASTTYLQFLNDGTGTTSTDGSLVGLDASENMVIKNQEATDMVFYTSNAFAGKIDANKFWLISATDVTPAHELIIYETGVSGSPAIGLQNGTTGVTNADGFILGLDSSENINIINYENTDIKFTTNGAFVGKIDASGGWLIADSIVTPQYDLSIYDSTVASNVYIHFINDGTGTTASDGSQIGISASEELTFRNFENTGILFYTNDTFVGKIDSSGNWLISDLDATPGQELIIYEDGISGTPALSFQNGDTGTAAGAGFNIGIVGSENAELRNYENTAIRFYTNNSFAGKIDSSSFWIISATDATPAFELIVHEDSLSGTPYIGIQTQGTGVTTSDGFLLGVDSNERGRLLNKEATDILVHTSDSITAKFGASGGMAVCTADITASYELILYDNGVGASSYIQFINDGTSSLTTDGTLVGLNTSEEFVINNQEATDTIFYTSGAFRGKIASGGNWFFGDSDQTPAHEAVVYLNTISTTPALAIQNGDTGALIGDGSIFGLTTTYDTIIHNQEATDIFFYINSAVVGKFQSGGGFVASDADITPTSELTVYSSSISGTPAIAIQNGDTGVGPSAGFELSIDGSEVALIKQYSAQDLNFYTSNTYRGGFEASGGFIVGNTSTVTPPGNDTILSYESSVSATNGLAIQSGGTGNLTSDGLFLGLDSSENILFNNAEANHTYFQVGGTSKFIVASNGGVVVGSSSASSGGDGTFRVEDGRTYGVQSSSSVAAARYLTSHTTYTGTVLEVLCNRSANAAYFFIEATSGASGTPDVEFSVDGIGQIRSDQGTASAPADYAEMFEWVDGNPNDEDRVGTVVVLEKGKIREATDFDDINSIIGVVSGNPLILGDAACNKWDKKYLRDEFNRPLVDKNKNRVLNPDFDPSLPYTPREDRKEWDAVGLVGKLSVRNGQKINPNWIELERVSSTVTKYLVR